MARKKKEEEVKEEIINEELVEETQKEIEPEEVDIISLDNKPVNNDIKEDKEEVPARFVPTKPVTKNKSKILVHNGRVYKELKNGYGMYADNGQVFKLNK